MLPIKIYLIIHQYGEWSANTFRSINELQTEWNIYQGKADVIGLVHIGFTRPETSNLSSDQFNPGWLYMTASARWVLDSLSVFAQNPICKIDNYPVYAVLEKWGYTKSIKDFGEVFVNIPAINNTVFDVNEFDCSWLKALEVQDTKLFEAALATGIFDEVSYLKNEDKLPPDQRQILGVFRFNVLSHEKNLSDHLSILNCAPPYILKTPLNHLQLSVRSYNSLSSVGINYVEDLMQYDQISILKIRNFGVGCIHDLNKCLLTKINAFNKFNSTNEGYLDSSLGQQFKEDSFNSTNTSSLIILDRSSFKVALNTSLDILNPKIKTILEKRMGVKSKALTLQATADLFNITRERIRQLAAKGIKTLKDDGALKNILEEKILNLFESRLNDGLSIASLPVLDTWFEGVDKYTDTLDYLFEYLLDSKYYLIKANGQVFISKISQAEWEALLNTAEIMIKDLAVDKITKSDARRRVEEILPVKANELRSELWFELQPRLMVSKSSDGNEFIVGVGKSSELMVESVLLESETPLHYSDVPSIILAKYGKVVEERRVASIFVENCFRFGPGTYGLRKHVPLTDEEINEIREKCEEIILSNSYDKQWNTSELLELIEESQPTYTGVLTHNLVNICLLDSKKLSNLKRNLWKKANGQSLGAVDRIEISQAVEAILINKGRPMSYSEIKDELSKERGLGQTFQLFSSESIIRMGSGEWGLLDRDLALSIQEQKEVVSNLEELLKEKGKGIHITEISDLICQSYSPAKNVSDPAIFFALAQRSELMRVSTGSQYLYLAEWGEPRRLTTKNAIEIVTKNIPNEGLKLFDIVERVSNLLGREIKRDMVYNHLVAAGVRHNPQTGLWQKFDLIADD